MTFSHWFDLHRDFYFESGAAYGVDNWEILSTMLDDYRREESGELLCEWAEGLLTA